MNKKGYSMMPHIIIGLVTVGVIYYMNTIYKWIKPPTETFALVQMATVAIIYSLLPDCDQPGSTINKYVTVALVGVIIWAFYNGMNQYGIIAAVVLGALRLIEHRTIIHSVLGALILSAPLLYFGHIYFIVGMIAFISHIVADNDFSWGWEKDMRW